MITHRHILQSVQPGVWFTTVDLKDAYFHVSIHPVHRKYLCFAFQGSVFEFSMLPFGLSLAPRTFSKCMDAILAPMQLQGIKVLNYLDNWLICSSHSGPHSDRDGASIEAGSHTQQCQKPVNTGAKYGLLGSLAGLPHNASLPHRRHSQLSTPVSTGTDSTGVVSEVTGSDGCSFISSPVGVIPYTTNSGMAQCLLATSQMRQTPSTDHVPRRCKDGSDHSYRTGGTVKS
ncbi:UNVERIFIED_CONTAM: hypothetical protein FKN15_012174 [Acipenser sinensis]